MRNCMLCAEGNSYILHYFLKINVTEKNFCNMENQTHIQIVYTIIIYTSMVT